MTDPVPENLDIKNESDFMKAIESLPQRKLIHDKDAIHWFRVAQHNDPERIGWHISRLHGLGGSDIGEIVADELGQRCTFSNPADISRQKLMREGVGESGKHTRRGQLFEPVIAQVFMEDYDAKRDCDLLDFQPDTANGVLAEHPWMGRGKPDDILLIEGGRYIVDYKFAATIPKKAPIQYAAQVHDYALEKALGNGLDHPEALFDGLIIAYFDYAKGEVRPIEVPFDEEIMGAIFSGGDRVWNDVMEGRTSKVLSLGIEANPAELDRDEKRILQLAEKEWLEAKLLEDAAGKQANQAKEHLLNLATRDGSEFVKDLKMPTKAGQISAREKPDEARIERVLAERDINPEAVTTLGKDMDTEKLWRRVVELDPDADPDDFMERKIDLKKAKALFESLDLAPPVIESPSIALRASKGRLNKNALIDLRERSEQVLETVRRDIESVVLDEVTFPQKTEPGAKRKADPDEMVDAKEALSNTEKQASVVGDDSTNSAQSESDPLDDLFEEDESDVIDDVPSGPR